MQIDFAINWLNTKGREMDSVEKKLEPSQLV